MGIEPTHRMVNIRCDGFEDRGHHQVRRRFPIADYRILGSLRQLSDPNAARVSP